MIARWGIAFNRHPVHAEHSAKGNDDPEMAEIARELQDECFELFKKAWTERVGRLSFKDGFNARFEQRYSGQYVESILFRMQGGFAISLWCWSSKPAAVDQYLVKLR